MPGGNNDQPTVFIKQMEVHHCRLEESTTGMLTVTTALEITAREIRYSGNMQWQKTYGPARMKHGPRITMTRYIVAGMTALRWDVTGKRPSEPEITIYGLK